MTRAGLAALAIAALGCQRAPARQSCADSLGGVWRDPTGHRWAVLDRGTQLEVYPDFADTAPPPGTPGDVELAPRAMDATRAGPVVAGTVRRRFMRADARCEAHAPFRILVCRGDALDVEVGEPPAATGFTPCAFAPAAAPAHATWTFAARLR